MCGREWRRESSGYHKKEDVARLSSSVLAPLTPGRGARWRRRGEPTDAWGRSWLLKVWGHPGQGACPQLSAARDRVN